MKTNTYNDDVTVVYVEQKKKQAHWTDIDNLKNILEKAFPRMPIISLTVLYHNNDSESQEVKLVDGCGLYSISKVCCENQEHGKRWMFSVLRCDNETNRVVFKYVHPETLDVFDDPNLVDVSTLPAII